MARALAFYRRLGLVFPPGADGETHTQAALPGGLRLLVDTHEEMRSFDASFRPGSGGHRLALSFSCGDPAGVERVYADLLAHGGTGHLPPWDASWGQRYATVHDPDGSAVDLFAPLRAQA
ncbi:glyoxalase [Kineococcus sp. R8]|nr:VOC family protein [Kineococcus siccus]NAZ81242.1 glyoxalase [Kineococcus siccus]